jgi:hypothetical protein
MGFRRAAASVGVGAGALIAAAELLLGHILAEGGG